MKIRLRSFDWLILVALLSFLTLPGRAMQFTAKRLDQLDKLGAFTPDFKVAVHDYVNVKDSIVNTQNEEVRLRARVPGLGQAAIDAQAKVDALQVELADYNHTDESDFIVLQKKMSDAGAKPQDQLVLAQTFVWSYPTSPHLPDAQMYLQQVQKVIADQIQAEKDAEAATAAARAKLLQRVHDLDLSLGEWQTFLANMDEDDVKKYLGLPQQQQGYYWIYTGPCTFDPVLGCKVGLQLNFNGGRVVTVVETGPAKPADQAPAQVPGGAD